MPPRYTLLAATITAAGDRYAFERCRAAGISDRAGPSAMDLVRRIVLDYRDLTGVFGGDSSRTHPSIEQRLENLQRWASEEGPAKSFGEHLTRRR